MKIRVDELQIMPANPKRPLLISTDKGNVYIKTDYPNIDSQAGTLLVISPDGKVNQLVLDSEGFIISEVKIR